MFKKITAATIVLSGLLLSSTSQAAEMSVAQLVGSLVSQAGTVTQQDISNSVQEAVLTANNTISMESDSDHYATNEVSVEQLVGSLISQAVAVTQQEIFYRVQEAVLTANNAIIMDSESESYATNVTITDLNTSATATNVQNGKAE